MILEQRDHNNAAFVTLTYEDGELPYAVHRDDGVPVETLDKNHLRKFIKDTRNSFGPFKYFAVGEYGMARDRPHYHLILYSDWHLYGRESKLEEVWGKGFVQYTHAEESRMAYCAKYTTKGFTGEYGNESGRFPEFSLKSNRPGIGSNQLFRLKDAYTTRNGAEAIVAFGDVGTTYRLRGKQYPIPEYHRVKLREALGIPKYAIDRNAGALKDKLPPVIDIDENDKQKAKAKRRLKIENKRTPEELRQKIERFNKRVHANNPIADLINR